MPVISFSRQRRLRKPQSIQNTFRSGRKVTGQAFSVIWKACSEEQRGICCNVVVGKRVCRSSVMRNRMKRLLREALRKSEAAFPEPRRGYVVVVGRRLPSILSLKSVEEELRACLKKLHD